MHKVFEETIRRITEESGLTGGAFALIEDGAVTAQECFGLADPQSGRPVTDQSFFDLASNSKAFTTMLGAQACDEGVFDWDAPVQRYMPEFTMLDPYVAAHITGRDMACHRSGMPRHDFMRTKVRGTRRDTVMRTAYMESTMGFREGYQYNNQMFIVLGYVLEQIYGKTWEQLVAEKIAGPLGMDMRFRGPNCDLSGLDCALPHMTDGHRAFPVAYANSGVSGPCGGIRTNLRSMIPWVQAMLHRGAWDGTWLCSERAWAELVKPQIPCYMDTAEEQGTCYALAWHTSVYRGHRVVSHGGSVDGFNSEVGLLPDDNKAFVLLVNTNSTPAPDVMRRMFLDYLTGALQEDYSPAIQPWIAQREEILGKIAAAKNAAPLTEDDERVYCGVFYHPSYDEFTISRRDGAVWFDYGGFHAALGRYADGVVRGYEDSIDPSYVELTPDAGGLRMKNADSELRLFFRRIG